MLLRPLIHLIKEELIGTVEILLERLASWKGIARIEVELVEDIFEFLRSWQTEFKALDFGADMLGDHGRELLVACETEKMFIQKL